MSSEATEHTNDERSSPRARSAKPLSDKTRKKTKAELVLELEALRERLCELEGTSESCEQLEDALRDLETRFESVSGITTDCIMEVDLGGNLLTANRPLPGSSVEIVVGEPVFEHFPDAQRRLMAERFARSAETRRPERFEMNYRDASGRGRAFEVRLAPVLQKDKVLAMTIAWADVSMRELAMEKARGCEEQLRSLRSEVAGAEAENRRESETNDGVKRQLARSREKLEELGDSLKYTCWAPTVAEVTALIDETLEKM